MTRSIAIVAARWYLVTAVLLSASIAAAEPQDGERVADAWCGFSVRVAEPWSRAPLRAYSVPGAIRCAWATPEGAALLVFLQEPGMAISPRTLVDASAQAQRTQLGAMVEQANVQSVAGMQAMAMVIRGAGNGSGIDGKGDVPTTQYWVAIPREQDVLVLLLTCPTAQYDSVVKPFHEVLKSLELEGQQTEEQKAAK